MDYSKTVNLLNTPFPMKGDLPLREPVMLKAWTEGHLYKKIQDKNRNAPMWLLHDGPPYANGVIHMGHALNKILKDFVVKYWALRGYRSPYKPGWDCHGLPIEHQLFKELGKNKHQVSRNEIRAKAKDFALGFVAKQRADFERLGVLADWENPYLTLADSYEASIVEAFFELHKKGLIYRKRKPGYWCAFDETALAEAEVEYADKTSDSVFVRFSIDAASLPVGLDLPQNTSVLIWTTTPWTLPANVALAFHPEEHYVVVKTNKGHLVVAEKLKEAVIKKLGSEGEVVGVAHRGKSFVGIKAINPLHGRSSRIVNATYVTMDDGTGIVHIAPGHGVEDFQVGLAYDLDVLSPVDEGGKFDSTVGRQELVGKHVLKDANKAVMELLGEHLLFHQPYRHSYPHCWRCKNPIIFRATKQWFLRVSDESRAQLLSEIEKVKWVPSYGIHRIRGMIEQRPDWCLSRQRHWGAPIAVLYCRSCREPILTEAVIEKTVQFISRNGASAWYEIPEPELSERVGAVCPSCHTSDVIREMDILDVWFDSGVSWFSVVEKEWKQENVEKVMYLEGSDQHRGWFQTSLIPSVMLRGRAPFDVVLTHGFVVDGKGHKMSKSMGNVISPQEVIQKFGADILRLWVAMSDYRDDVRLSKDIMNQVIDTYRKFRNTFRFLLQNTADFRWDEHRVPFNHLEEIDRWILSQFEDVKQKALSAYEANEFHVVLSELNRFASGPLSGFYFDALKDRLYCEVPSSLKRRSTQTALAILARNLTVLLSPLMSFTCEEAYVELRRTSRPNLPESVFLDDVSALDRCAVDPQLNLKWQRILGIRTQVNDVLDRVRKSGSIKSSQEASVSINLDSYSGEDRNLVSSLESEWPFLLQMAEVSFTSSDKDNSVEIVPSEFAKCERCWRHRKDVGQDQVHPTLCERCVAALPVNS